MNIVFSSIFFFFLFLTLSSSDNLYNNIIIDFPIFTSTNLTLLGDAFLRNGVVSLTGDLRLPSSRSGSLVYSHPISLFDPQSDSTASFSTRFSFSIDNVDPSSFGDGITFFISPNNHTPGSPGAYLGLINSSKLTKNRFLAVEFDTRMDPAFHDPDDNHVGFDIDSLVSVKTANPIIRAINLKSGNLITAWIDYLNEEKKVEVFLSYSGLKPDEPILSVSIDLSDYLKDLMFVGFSASTNRSTEQHFVSNWSLRTLGLRLIRPRTHHPYNVSENSVVTRKKRPNPFSGFFLSRHRMIGLGLGIGFPALFCAIVVALGWLSVLKLRGGDQLGKDFKTELMTRPRQFTYKELKFATGGFHPSRILGSGAFGTVYKASFGDCGMVSAVKKSKHSHEGKAEFLAELSTIACLRHKNLVQLQGWCAEKGELLLVYEYMPNGSLDKVLHQGSVNGIPLQWPHRFNIALGLASALSYLHQECEQRVIHRDVKTSNIMLDGNYNPKLGDFGLARQVDHGMSPASTLTAGTMGYLAPEYLQYGKATEKTDVFSYGVVILELASGNRPIKREEGTHRMVNLVDWVWELHTEGNTIAAADQRLGGEFDKADMEKLLLVGLSCANPASAERPTMRKVVQILNNETELVAVPRVKPRLSFSNSVPLSINGIVECGDDLEIAP